MQSIDTTKYVIHTKISAEGVIEKSDIVGAIFGQTEGLLGKDLDLRELQKTGRIGRIEVAILTKNGKTKGNVLIPSSLDKVKTSILSASLETIDRIGPCLASIEVIKIEDIRSIKRAKIIERAKIIYSTMFSEDILESQEISDIIKEAVKIENLIYFGKSQMAAGPHYSSQDIIIVEGRADILTLLKYGIKNTLSVGGTNIPMEIAEFIKNKTVTVFTDSDRGGELIIKELLQVSKIDFIAMPPTGKSVEDLVQREVLLSLRNKIPIQQYINNYKDDSLNLIINNQPISQTKEIINNETSNKIKSTSSIIAHKKIIKRVPKILKKNLLFLSSETSPLNNKEITIINSKYTTNNKLNFNESESFINDKKKQLIYNHSNELSNTLKARILTSNYYPLFEFSIRELVLKLKKKFFSNDVMASVIIFDGVITQKLVDIANTNGFVEIIGSEFGFISKKPLTLKLAIVKKKLNIKEEKNSKEIQIIYT